jgi:hypothetical protein
MACPFEVCSDAFDECGQFRRPSESSETAVGSALSGDVDFRHGSSIDTRLR